MKSHILFLIIVFSVGLFSQTALGQVGNRVTGNGTGGLCSVGGGAFTVTPQQACANTPLAIKNMMPGAPTVYITTNYDEKTITPSGTKNLASVTYSLAGTYTILQEGTNVQGTEFSKCEVVTIYENRGVTTDPITACGAGKIKLSIINDAIYKAYDRVEVDWGDGSEKKILMKGDPLTMDYTYSDVNSKPSVKIQGFYDGKGCASGNIKTLPVTFVKPELSKIRIKSVEMTAGSQVRLSYVGVAGVYTNFMYSKNQGVTFEGDETKNQGGDNLSYTYSSKANFNKSQTYFLKLQSKDLCESSFESPVVVSTMSISGTASDEETNNLQWSLYPVTAGFTHYELLRDGEVIETFTDVAKTSYVDEDVICGNPYEYRIRAVLEDVTSISAPIDVTTKTSTIGLKTAKVSVISQNSVEISVELPGTKAGDGYELSLSRAEAESATFKRLPTIAGENSYLDKDLNTSEKSYCYRITYTNSCRNTFPPVGPICTILLKDDKLPTLNWIAELPPMLEGIGSYEIHENAVSTDVGMNTTHTPVFSDKSILEYTFQVVAISKDKKFQSLSNTVDMSRNVALYIPDAFTPNDDEDNAMFEVKGDLKLLNSFKMIIFNRWGKPIFSSTDIRQGWDGNVDDTRAPEGSYIYTISYEDILGQTVKKKGTFMLLR